MEQQYLRFVSDLWVVDMRGDKRIVACRSPWERRSVGRCLSEFLSSEEIARVSSTLFSYEMKPILTETAEGNLWIVLPSLMPSCTAAIVLIPMLDRKMTLRFLTKRSGISFACSESLAAEAAGRMPGKVTKHEAELALLLKEIRAFDFHGLAPSVLDKERRIDGFLRRRIEAISRWTGCSAEVEPLGEIKNSECFDFGMFTHFLMTSFLLCRVAALDRCATVGWKKDAVTVRFLCEKEVFDGFWLELETPKSLAEERLMRLGCEWCDGWGVISLCPRRVDVSYLGLKAKNPLV